MAGSVDYERLALQMGAVELPSTSTAAIAPPVSIEPPTTPVPVIPVPQSNAITQPSQAVDYEEMAREMGATEQSVPKEAALPSTQEEEGILSRMGGIIGGIKEGIVEGFTGEKRTTPEIEKTKDWQHMPEYNKLSNVLKNVGVSINTLTTGPEETAKIILTAYPDLDWKTDSKGNYIFISKIDKKEYGIKPGFGVQDAVRGVGAMVPFSYAAKAKTLVEGAKLGAATEAGIQAAQALGGGSFDTGDILAEAVMGPAGDIVGRAVKGAASGAKKMLSRKGADVVEKLADVPAADAPIAKEAMDPFDEVDELIDYEISAAEKADLAKAAVGSVEGVTGKEKSSRKLAEKAAINPEILESAKRLKVERNLQPDHMSSDFAFKELSQLVKSQKGSSARDAEQRGLSSIGDKFKKMLVKFGATDNLGGLNDEIEETMSATVKAYSEMAERAYGKIAKKIPDTTEVGTPNTQAYFDSLLAKAKGDPDNLEGVQKDLYKWIEKDPNPTYHMLDEKRQSIGAKINQRDAFSSKDQARLKRMYGHITKDLEGSLNEISPGLADDWEYAKGLVRVRKGVEDDMRALFGAKLDKSIVNKLIQSNAQLGKTDGKKFAALMKSIPKEHRQEFAASSLLKAFGNAAEDGVLNYKAYSTWWDNMSKNKQAQSALLSNLPKGASQRLHDIANVTRGVADSRKKYTGTGASLQGLIDPADGLMTAVMRAGKTTTAAGTGYAMGGPTGAAIGATAGVLMSIKEAVKSSRGKASVRIHDLMSSKEFLDMAIAAAEEGPAKDGAMKRLLRSPKFKTFASTVKIKHPEAWLKSALRTTARPAARGEVEARQEKER